MAFKCVALLLLQAAALGLSAPPQFNNTKCPAYWELQAPHVATDFRESDIPGYYYELAFHDLTQRPLCPDSKARCITSEKVIQTHSDGVKYVNDTWNLACFGHTYPETLLFNITDQPGYLRGYVPVTKIPFLPKSFVKGLLFPDTVVDFKSGPEGWLLEMQCVEASFGGQASHVMFVGINFYSKLKTEAAFQEMYAAAKARGLGLWMDSKPWGLTRVDHSECPTEPAKAGNVVV